MVCSTSVGRVSRAAVARAALIHRQYEGIRKVRCERQERIVTTAIDLFLKRSPQALAAFVRLLELGYGLCNVALRHMQIRFGPRRQLHICSSARTCDCAWADLISSSSLRAIRSTFLHTSSNVSKPAPNCKSTDRIRRRQQARERWALRRAVGPCGRFVRTFVFQDGVDVFDTTICGEKGVSEVLL